MTETLFQLNRLSTPMLQKQAIDYHSLMYAGEEVEFFYKKTDEVVPEGEPIGIDIETDEGVALVLFSDIYWNPDYE